MNFPSRILPKDLIIPLLLLLKKEKKEQQTKINLDPNFFILSSPLSLESIVTEERVRGVEIGEQSKGINPSKQINFLIN